MNFKRLGRSSVAAVLCTGPLAACEFTTEPLLSFLNPADEAAAADPAAEAVADVAPAAGDPAAGPGMADALPAMAEPLIVVRFDDPAVEFGGAVGEAAGAALVTHPLGIFEVHGLAPDTPSLAGKAVAVRQARASAERVMRVLAASGVPPAQLQLSARTESGLGAPQVNVYVR